jgi:cyclic pyranopterin phosphate synthase
MIDNNDRHINYLRVSITDRCNLRCVYCMPKEGVSAIGHNDILTYEEILRVIKTAVQTGIVKVRVTGGEPLVRKGIVDFLASLKQIDGLKDITLTTNGILLENFAERLFNAGIRRINISLDSLNAEKYASITRGGNLKAVLGGIDKVEKAGFSPIKINVVVIKGVNEDEVLDFAKIAIEKPYQVRFIELMPVGEVGADNNDKYVSNDSVMEKIEKYNILEPASSPGDNTDGPARIYSIQGGRGKIGFISAVSHNFCESCNRLRLTADGHLRACLLSDEEIDLKDPLRSGCSDSELEDLIKTIIAKKPTRYDTSISDKVHFKKCVRDMRSIGG